MVQGNVDLSVVIPSYNTRQLLLDCLRSIDENSLSSGRLEVVVVDNGSTDGTVAAISNFQFPISNFQIIRNRKNLGFARAVNQGWKEAKGQYILFLNSDTLVRKGDLDVLLSYARGHEDVGAVSGKLTLRDGTMDPDCHRGFPTPWSSITYFLGLEKLFPRSRLFARYHQGWKKTDTIHEIDAGAGALLLVRRSLLEKIGGWDEDYFFYGEDVDLCYRIKQEGLKVVFYPKTRVVHYKGASSGLRRESSDVAKPDRDNLIRVTKGSVDAWKIFYKKFYKDKYPFWVTWLVLLGIEVRGSLRILYQRVRLLL